MKKSKGFTLIELLAVIIVLAIIALIAVPTILGVIEKAKKGSVESSALGYIDAVEKQMAINEVDSSKTPITDGTYTVEQLTSLDVTVKGETPENESLVKIENNQVADYSLKIGDYIVNYDEETNAPVATKNGTLKDMKVTSSQVHSNGTAIYYNPVTNTSCSASEAVSTTGTKTGCMKWYMYAEDSNSYTMILDHNTTDSMKYNSTSNNSSSDVIDAALLDLVNTSKWVVTPRLITADEIAKITGNKTFKSSTSTFADMFYFETNTGDYPDSYNGTYAWLYDYTNGCLDYGCSVEDSSTYGYWTSTPVVGDTDYVWIVINNGSLSEAIVNVANGFGLRPVITISKSIISQ